MLKYEMENQNYIKNLKINSDLMFDYEITTIKLDEKELKTKLYYLEPTTQTFKIINYNKFYDSLILDDDEQETSKSNTQNLYKANFLKRLASKKKKRFQTENYDLDLSYVTQRVIALGYPSTGCETIYRNSLNDIKAFFQQHHNNQAKIYNLCIEKERVYRKELFGKIKVGLFPSKDHNPCPIKLILEFCVDIYLFLIRNPNSVAGIHCKAGKGRTGVMICCYLIFSGLCLNSKQAIEYYGHRRTINNKGVTIASQIRYIEYFESFLTINFQKPYTSMIPIMIKHNLNQKTTNILLNFLYDDTYFKSPNLFYINKIKIGPFDSESSLAIKLSNFMGTKIEFLPKKNIIKENNNFYYVETYEKNYLIDSDMKIEVSGYVSMNFYLWINLWYSTLNIIKKHINDIEELVKKSNPKKNFQTKFSIQKIDTKKIDLMMKAQNTKRSQSLQIQNSPKISRFDAIDNNLEIENDEVNESRNLNSNKDVNLNELEDFPIQKENLLDLIKIIDSTDHKTDLNNLLKIVNRCKLNNTEKIDSNDLNLVLYKKDLDKFHSVKKINDGFYVAINYSMLE